MDFTTSCFIRMNTPELRKHLERIGHHICSCVGFKDWSWLDCSPEYGVHGIPERDEFIQDAHAMFLEENSKNKTPIIDCGTNEELFLSLAALRDDSDVHQWFVYNDHWWLCYDEDIELARRANADSCQAAWFHQSHKATVEELIEHFKSQ